MLFSFRKRILNNSGVSRARDLYGNPVLQMCAEVAYVRHVFPNLQEKLVASEDNEACLHFQELTLG